MNRPAAIKATGLALAPFLLAGMAVTYPEATGIAVVVIFGGAGCACLWMLAYEFFNGSA